MKESFTNDEGILLVKTITMTIRQNREYLSEVDSVGGDGDHGINMSKGFTFVDKELSINPTTTMSDGFRIISTILTNKIGGSMGPLYGSFFLGLAVASLKEVEINKLVMGKMLIKAFDNISAISDAKVGDKTLIDVLSPAVKAYIQAVEEDKSFEDCVTEMGNQAKSGLEATKKLAAKVGRASRIGERSIGHQDAGATSCYLILEAMKDSVVVLLEEK